MPSPVAGLVRMDWNFSLKSIQLESDSEHTSTHPVLPLFVSELPILEAVKGSIILEKEIESEKILQPDLPSPVFSVIKMGADGPFE